MQRLKIFFQMEKIYATFDFPQELFLHRRQVRIKIVCLTWLHSVCHDASLIKGLDRRSATLRGLSLHGFLHTFWTMSWLPAPALHFGFKHAEMLYFPAFSTWHCTLSQNCSKGFETLFVRLGWNLSVMKPHIKWWLSGFWFCSNGFVWFVGKDTRSQLQMCSFN